MLKSRIEKKLKESYNYNQNNLAFNRTNDLQFTNLLIDELKEILAAENIEKELNRKMNLYKDHEKINQSTGKYTFIYNIYLVLKRIKENKDY